MVQSHPHTTNFSYDIMDLLGFTLFSGCTTGDEQIPAEDTINQINTALLSDSTNQTLLHSKGDALENLNLHDTAILAYGKIVNNGSEDYQTFNNQVPVLYHYGWYEDAFTAGLGFF